MDDEMVAQLIGVSTILSGKYAFQVGVVAPRASGAEADVELRFHQRAAPGGDDDRVRAQHVKLNKGERQVVDLSRRRRRGQARQFHRHRDQDGRRTGLPPELRLYCQRLDAADGR